jgi:S1-C subfamily serine protease
MSWWIRFFLLSAAILCCTLDDGRSQSSQSLSATGPSPSSGDPRFIVDDEAYEKNASKEVDHLAKEEKLVGYVDLAKKTQKTRPETSLCSIATSQLSPTELADKLRRSTVAMGLRYQEPRSKKWRFMIGATGFAVAPEILSTSLHVMTLDPEIMRAAQAVAVTDDGKVYPVTEIIAASDRADTCLVRVPGLKIPPLPVRGGALPGEQVWCMSHPDGFTYMFTSGQVARVSRDRYDDKHQPSLHLEVTAEYCPGSSGGAVTDAAGNVLGQVSSINNYDGFSSHDGKAINGIVAARTCTAAEEILALAKPGENEPVPLPSPAPSKKHRAPKPQPSPGAAVSPSPRPNSR